MIENLEMLAVFKINPTKMHKTECANYCEESRQKKKNV